VGEIPKSFVGPRYYALMEKVAGRVLTIALDHCTCVTVGFLPVKASARYYPYFGRFVAV